MLTCPRAGRTGWKVAAAVLAGALTWLPGATASTQGAATTSASVSVSTAVSVATPTVNRLAGPNRYATAVAISQTAFPSGQRPAVVFLASGVNYPDALSAAPAAAALGGISLITQPAALPQTVESELRRLAPAKIVILGQQDAVSAAVETVAQGIAPVARLAGRDRFETSRLVAAYAFGENGSPKAWVATGLNYPDALSAGAAAGAHRAPIILVRGTAASVDDETAELLTDLGSREFVIAGSAATVSSGIEASLAQRLPGATVSRAGGSNRYETSALLAAQAFPSPTPGRAVIATGLNYPDALVGAAYAGRLGRPLLLSPPLCATESIRQVLLGPAYTSLTLLGNSGALRGLVGTLEPCRSLSTASSLWVVVNKHRPFSSLRYVPSGLVTPSVRYPNGHRLRSDAAAATRSMFAAAAAEGAGQMSVVSGYRSYDTQATLYATRLRERGQAYADAWIARPGYSEHQSGLTLDIGPVGASGCGVFNCLESTPQGRWLAANSWRFGFILRYQSGQEVITGYNPEPWHFRYVGVPLATDYYRDGWRSLEAYAGLPAAPSYARTTGSTAGTTETGTTTGSLDGVDPDSAHDGPGHDLPTG